MAATKFNLVLEGGGVKGIAHVGALAAFETPALSKAVEIAGVGGSSVGALIAALYAAGYSAADLREELNATPLTRSSLDRDGP